MFDQPNTPRFFPGPDEFIFNAGVAHTRLHAATRAAGISVRGGNPDLSNVQLLLRYRSAYRDPALRGIQGTLRTPDGSTVLGENLSPYEAFRRLIQWGRTGQ